jgi:hypothetical protein
MYLADFICTYKLMDELEDQEKLYCIQLLQAFGLDNWDDDIVNSSLVELYTEMKEDLNLQAILLKVSTVETLQLLITMAEAETHSALEKQMVLFNLLFQYEYFDLFHRCIIDFRINGLIRDKNLETILAHF